jgi:hypothetical protein
MKYLCFLVLLFVACNSPQKKGAAPKSKPLAVAANYITQTNSINTMVNSNHQLLTGKKGDFNSFKSYLQGLSDRNLYSIPFAMDYIKTCLPADLPERDSVVLLFNLKFYKVTNLLSESLENKYLWVGNQIDSNKHTAKLKAFKANLKDCGIGVFSSEGNYYLDVLPDYFYQQFKDRVSAGVQAYLEIRRHELAEGFSEDAGMLISFKQLYQRVKNWEKYLDDYPHTVYGNEADNYYTNYLETLLTGMDNSRVFDDVSNVLLPEVKIIYEKAIRDEPASRTAQYISKYYSFLGRHNFTYTDSVDVFLQEHKLSTELGVQPDTR